jgi:RNA polymerase primary sigma factor
MVGIAAAAETLHAGEKVCVLVPTRELLDQWTEKLRHHLPAGTRIGRLGDGSRDTLLHFDVLVAIVNSARTTDVRATQGHGLLIADECHRYGSEVNQQALDPRFSRRLGLSATYARSDDGHLEWLDPYLGGTCFQLGYRLAIADEVTAHFNVAFVGCRFTDGEASEYAEVSSTAAKSRQLLVQQHGVPAEPFGEFMRAVTQMAEGGSEATWPARRYLAAFQRRKQLLAETPAKAGALALITHAVRGAERTIVFTQTIAASEGAAAQLRASRLNVEAVHCRVDTVGRKNILKRFGTGQTQVLVAPQVLDEGIDVPAADLAIIVAASRTRRQMIQRMGRVLRRKPDNRLARFAVLYVEGTSEDPGYGAHEDFLDEITEVAEGVRVFPAGADSASISAFLNTTKAAVTPPGPRWAGEPAEADAPQSGKDVMFDLSAVAVPGAGTEREPLGWQPPLGEVGAESERPAGVVATVDVGGQSFSQPLSVGALGTRRVPAAMFTTGHGIEPVVDHRVPAVALLRDVALHRDPSLWGLDGRDPVEGSVEARVAAGQRVSCRQPERRDGRAARRGGRQRPPIDGTQRRAVPSPG